MESAFDELIEAAKRLGITVRHARLGGVGGGLAMVKAKRQLFIDLDALPEDQLDQTISAMAGVKELDNVFLKPELRRLLDQAKQ